MGDGGVACAPSRSAMERLPASEAYSVGALASKAFKMRRADEEEESGELEKGEFVPDREAGEFIPEPPRRVELERGEYLPEKRRKGGEAERLDCTPPRPRRVELEKGELVMDRRRDRTPDDNTHRRRDGDRDRTPDDYNHRRRDGDWRRDNDRTPEDSYGDGRKRLSSKLEKCETGVSRKCDEVGQGQHRYEFSDGKGQCYERDYHGENRQKRHCSELDGSGRKYYADHADRSGSKSWREAEDWKRPASWDRSYRDSSSSSSRVSSVGRYPLSRRYELSGPSRGGGYDRHGRSPERARHHDPHDRSPSYSERAPRESTRQYDHMSYAPGSSERQRHQDYRDATPNRYDRSSCEKGRFLDHRDRTPSHSDRSPHERTRYRDHRDRTPNHSDRSPQERARYQDQRVQSPSHSGRSPHSYRDRTPGRSEHSSHDHARNVNPWAQYRKTGGSEKQQNNRYEERPVRESSRRDAPKINSDTQPNNISSNTGVCDKMNKVIESGSPNKEPVELALEPPPPPPPPSLPPQPEANGVVEELLSMEEDMDICDTPPHDTMVTDFGKWFYIDHFGIERGPSKLADLKMLVEEGFLHSDHFIKHSDACLWVTVENAASPSPSTHFPSIVSDAVTQMVTPPESPGNLLCDGRILSCEKKAPKLPEVSQLDDASIAPESVEDLSIDERVKDLLNGHTIEEGKELEGVGEALRATFKHVEWENWDHFKGFTRFQVPNYESRGFVRDEGTDRPGAPLEEYVFNNCGSSNFFSGRWSCKGGDWRRNDETGLDRNIKKKFVLNEGYPLCQTQNCGLEDPRVYRRDDNYPSCVKKLDVLPWSFSLLDDKNENDASKNMLATGTGQMKLPMTRCGTQLGVVRINACVVKGHVSFEPRGKLKGKERHSSRSTRAYSTSDVNSVSQGSYQSKKLHGRDLRSLHECRTALNIPKDHVCTVNELSLHLGEWYYLDGAGHEHGPSSYLELQELATNGTIPEHSSVFRKIDNAWLPITRPVVSSEAVHTINVSTQAAASATTPATQVQIIYNGTNNCAPSFHNVYPQFVGYVRGKIHELVMKSYKNREFAAAINEVLDPWLSSRQAKKDMDKPFSFNSSITKSSVMLARDSSGAKFWRSDSNTPGTYEDNGQTRAGKRPRLLVDGSGESEGEEPLFVCLENECSFEDLCGEAAFVEDDGTSFQAEAECWGSLNGQVLARIFHFLRADIKSLFSSANTCKHWNTVAKFYNSLCKHVEWSAAGLNCTDSMFQSIMRGYERNNITSIGLAGCSNVSASVLEEVLLLFPCLSSVDIRGCSQFKDLECKYRGIKWIKISPYTKTLEESRSKVRSLRQIADDSFSGSYLDSYLNDVGESGYFGSHERNMVDRKDSSSNTFRQGFYKRRKLLDSKKSSTTPSRDARMRHWMYKKSENGNRKMEEFITLSLKYIMKANRFEFFVPQVAKIEGRLKSGYYNRCGFDSVKDDICRMCRDALKKRNHDNAGDLHQVIKSFIKLAESLIANPKLSRKRDEMIKKLKDGSDAGFYSLTKSSKKQHKISSEKRGNRSHCTSYSNGGTDYGSYAVEYEIKRSLSKLKKKNTGFGSETSDDNDNDFTEVESSASDTDSDMDLACGKGDLKDNRYLTADEDVAMDEDREWGARMTTASHVPPVTRTYELIDRYIVIADEEEVQRKMRVSLPDDFPEKLLAQKNGMEESDMELPRVKEYKPRKLLGVEVLEQEVYGIDPYTHNLLLDSMPDEDWPLDEKHKFIEEVLLCILNKQVRRFTGVGHTPMVYSLRSVVEEILKSAVEEGDRRILKMCQTILKAMQARPDDNYVAYRKGLGVVCNKEEGFGEDDFVVEFLGEVYPTWKWFEKQDGVKSLQKNKEEQVPEFYNIYLERPKGDRDGYDLVVVDAMHKANFASRICHSCRPNCEAKVTAVDGKYQIGIYTVRPISYGEEITFDYNCVTDSMKEYEDSVCLCGSHVCRGSYLNLTGEDAFQKVLTDCHGILDRHKCMLEACETNSVSEEDYIDLGKAGLGTCLLAGLPDWLVAYSAHLVRYMNFERTQLPEEILKHNLEDKKNVFSDLVLEAEKNEAEVQAEGVYNSRLQNMAITLDKVRYVMRCVFGDPKTSPPPLQKLSPEAMVSVIWQGDGSLVEELLNSMALYVDEDTLSSLKSKIDAHNPSRSGDLRKELRKSLVWLRDELRRLPCSYKCRHDAAADLIHLYAFTKNFFRVKEYKAVRSPPVSISPLDLGPKYVETMGPGLKEYCKTYDENYCLSQLMNWHSSQPKIDPVRSLAEASRGCLALPDISSFYAKPNKSLSKHIYGSNTRKAMMARMERQPQAPWPEDKIWSFKSKPRFYGSPMLDAVLSKGPLDREMMHWLRTRHNVFLGADD